MENLRGGISDLINALNKLGRNTVIPEEQEEIQKVLRVLFALWEEVIRQELDASKAAYKTALKRLETAESDAKKALKDMKKVAAAVKSAVKAAKALDKVVKLFVDIFV